MTPRPRPPRWVLLNQSQSPAFQQMIERLSNSLGSAWMLTGSPHPSESTPDAALKILPGPAYDRRGKVQRALSWGRYLAWSSARALPTLIRQRPLLFVTTNPPMLPHLAWLYHKVLGGSYALLIWDIYPDHMVQMGWIPKGGLAERLWLRLNRAALSNAALTVTLGPSMTETLRQHAKDPNLPVTVIPNWANTDLLRPIPREENDFAKQHKLGERTVVLYSGNMGGSHGMDAIAEAATILRDREDIHFLLIGDGLGRGVIEAAIKQHKLSNVTLLPLQPWDVIPTSLACADIAIVSQAAGTEHLSVPSKTYSLLAVGAALIGLTSPDSDLAKLITTHEVGFHIRSKGNLLAEAILSLTSAPRSLSLMRTHARKAAEQHFSAEVVFSQLHDALAPHISTPLTSEARS